MNVSEAELVRRVKAGRDMTAFRDLVQNHEKRIYYLIRKIVRRHEDTQELLQDTFIKSLKNIDKIKDDDRFGSWLSSIAVNLAFDHYKKERRTDHISMDGDYPPEAIAEQFTDMDRGEKPLESLQNEEMRMRIREAIAKLPDRYRTAFSLFHLHDMDAREISDIMNCPVNTVRTFIFRGIRILRDELKEYYHSCRE